MSSNKKITLCTLKVNRMKRYLAQLWTAVSNRYIVAGKIPGKYLDGVAKYVYDIVNGIIDFYFSVVAEALYGSLGKAESEIFNIVNNKTTKRKFRGKGGQS